MLPVFPVADASGPLCFKKKHYHVCVYRCSYSLMVRTQDFESCNLGSIPSGNLKDFFFANDVICVRRCLAPLAGKKKYVASTSSTF